MRKALIIAGKEFASYFRSGLAYIILIVTVVVFNVFFFLIIEQNREASLKDVFLVMEFMFVFLVPLLTMKLFAKEKDTGTMEFLMTTPTSCGSIVLGKYLGSLMFFSFIISLSVVYYGIIEYYASPDRMATLGGFIGIWLEGAAFLSVGMLASSWTKSQTGAAIISYCMLFMLYFSMSFLEHVEGTLEVVIRSFSTITHLSNFAVGLLTLADFIYYLSIILFCMMLTKLSINTRLWQ